MTTTIFRIYTFEAAHFLSKVPPSHICARMHGHTYRVELYVTAPGLDGCGMVMDYGDIDFAWSQVEHLLDHRVLNEVPGLENPTIEVMAPWLWQKLQLSGLSRIVLHEGTRAGVIYEGPPKADAPRTPRAAAEREARDESIRQAWAKDKSPENRQLLAAKHGLSEDRIRDILYRRERPARKR